MRLELGHPVQCTDGLAGEVVDVVIDPTRKRVTHLVVAPRHHHSLARLVPIELVRNGKTSPTIALDCTVEELKRLPEVDEFAFLRLSEYPASDPDWDVGIETVLAQPYYDSYAGFGLGPRSIDFDAPVGITYDRIPKGEVEVRRASSVYSADDHRLGRVEGFLVDGDELITHVLLERGHVFGRREVAIPIGAVARVVNDWITLTLAKDSVERLPSVRLRRWEMPSGADRPAHAESERSAR